MRRAQVRMKSSIGTRTVRQANITIRSVSTADSPSAAAAVFSITGIVLSLVERRTNTNVKLFWYVNLFECSLTFMTYALWWLYTMLVAGGSYYEGTRETVRLIMLIIALAFPVLLGAVVYLAAKWLSPSARRRSNESETNTRKAI